MRAVEAVIEVSPDGSAVVITGKMLKPGLHKILIIADETALADAAKVRKEKKQFLDLKTIHQQAWPKKSTFRREDIYNDEGR
jgi:hypothetical protein